GCVHEHPYRVVVAAFLRVSMGGGCGLWLCSVWLYVPQQHG
ncbi:hypothetical protein HMPREF9248_0871, partial [Fannyhessea vaginae PB189-T1-4]